MGRQAYLAKIAFVRLIAQTNAAGSRLYGAYT